MPNIHDGPRSPHFLPVRISGNTTFDALADAGASAEMVRTRAHAPEGSCTGWGMPFDIERPLFVKHEPISIKLKPFTASWLVFMHATDVEPLEWNTDGFISSTRGVGRLGEHVADYVLVYSDGTEARHAIKRRHQIGMFNRQSWGENCFECVQHQKSHAIPPVHEQPYEPPFRGSYWGWSQTRAHIPDTLPWVNYLWALENPSPKKKVVGLRVEPFGWGLLLSALAQGTVKSHPLRWQTRQKAVLTLPKGESFNSTIDAVGRLRQVQLDMGQVISARPRNVYPNESWDKSYNNQPPVLSDREVLVEYTAHPDATFVLGTKRVPVKAVATKKGSGPFTSIAPATQRIAVRVLDKTTKQPVPVKFHAHGAGGEYLAPLDRNRIPNPGWIEDWNVDYVNENSHFCSYISGETTIDVPLGPVYFEVSKGFEIKPVRKIVEIKATTKTVTITLDRVLPWRDRGWVSADTHVHFLSPTTALLEGAAEGVNVVNLLASQWGELMTNVGDFDGKTTHGSKEMGGDGEHLVRVGTENRQHVLGHISLLGYEGQPILPLCVGGPDESALGDPIGALMAEWAMQCREQGGLVVMPHFPNPRCENAANLVSGQVDAVEMCSWEQLYKGIDPYSLSDWYRYLNCGYFYPAVGGTDKMTAATAVGALRTYTRIPKNKPFNYTTWMDAIRTGNTFVTYGPLVEFSVEGKPAGARFGMRRSGGTVAVSWSAASCTIPMSRVDLIVNGEIRESERISTREAAGEWEVKVDRSSWIALLVRGHYKERPEIIAAHSSPVMVEVMGTPFFAAADAMTILVQIEGALAFIDTIGKPAEVKAYKRMRAMLTTAHRKLHNEMHRQGHAHKHTHAQQHAEHR